MTHQSNPDNPDAVTANQRSFLNFRHDRDGDSWLGAMTTKEDER